MSISADCYVALAFLGSCMYNYGISSNNKRLSLDKSNLKAEAFCWIGEHKQ